MKFKSFLCVSVLASLMAFSGCFSSSDPGEPAPLPLPSNTVGPPLGSGNTTEVLQTFQPALAVRGINCMLCHAVVNSSVLTDFGYGDPQFFVGSTPGTYYPGNHYISNSKPLTLPWYGNYYGTMQLANQINGTLVVPNVTITDPTFMNSISSVYSQPSITLAQVLDLDLGASYYGDAPWSGAGPMDAQVNPLGVNPKVTEIDSLYIGAPTATEILSLAPNLSGGTPGWQALGDNGSISGLVVQSGTGGSFVTNSSSTIACYGDIVISGALLLNNVTITTDNEGCRLMVTQSVFIQGQILFSDLSGTQNLQISSAESVISGFSPTTLASRFGAWYPDSQPLTRAPGTNTQKNAAIIAEANVIGASLLHDSTDAAHCPTQMVTYIGYNGGGSQQSITQCSIDFQRLLLNAPNIQSRYIGTFTGVAIAEIALFAPGALNFAYDPTFSQVPILPILNPVLSSGPSPD